jgi:hypothetical protein
VNKTLYLGDRVLKATTRQCTLETFNGSLSIDITKWCASKTIEKLVDWPRLPVDAEV